MTRELMGGMENLGIFETQMKDSLDTQFYIKNANGQQCIFNFYVRMFNIGNWRK